MPDAELPPSVFARMTGLTVPQLRRFDARGHLVPEDVHPTSGHRRYSREQVRPGRLLAALVALGMPVPTAAQVVARQDGSAVLAHLDVVDAALGAVRESMPPVGSRPVRWRSSWQEDLVTPAEPLGPVPDALTAVLAARTALAAALGCEVSALPAAEERERGFPDGPVVILGVGQGWVEPLTSPAALTEVLLPWPTSDPPPDGFRYGALPQARWAISDLDEDGRGADVATVTEAVAVLATWLTGQGPHLWSLLAVAYDADLRTAALAIACRPL